jgi:hypothetical protein
MGLALCWSFLFDENIIHDKAYLVFLRIAETYFVIL